jgi:hypothetical protein
MYCIDARVKGVARDVLYALFIRVFPSESIRKEEEISSGN